MAGKLFFEICFANTVFHKRAMLQIFYAEYTESVLDIFSFPESNVDPPWLNQEKYFLHVGFQKPGECYFMIGFCKCNKCSL